MGTSQVKSSKKASRKATRVQDIPAQFQALLVGYVRALQEAQTDAQRRYSEAGQKYYEDLKSSAIANDVQKTYEEFVREAQACCVKQETGRYMDAANTLAANLQQAQKSVLDHSNSAARRLTESVEQLSRDSAKRIDGEHLQFSKSVRELMSQIDPDSLDAPTMAWIGQAMIAAAALTGARPT